MGLKDIADALKELLDRLAGEPAPQPIPVRIGKGRRAPRR